MSDNEDVYAAIRKYQAAGDTANVGKLVNYLKAQPASSAQAASLTDGGATDPAEVRAALQGRGGPETMALSAVQAVSDVTGRVWDIMTTGSSTTRKAERAQANADLSGAKAAYPGWAAVGESVPALATMPLPGGIVAQGVYGAGLAALSTDENVGSEALKGGALGAGSAAVGTLAGKAIGGIRALASGTDELGNLGRAAVDAGLPVTPAQAMAESGQRTALSKVEAAFESLPWTDIGAARIAKQQKTLLAQSAAKAIGQQSDLITPAVLDSAAKDIGLGIESVTGKLRPFHLPPSLKEGLDKVITTEPFIDINTGVKMTGETFASTRSALNDVSQKAWRAGDAPKAKFVDGLIDRLDSIATVRGVDESAYGKLRSQWRMLRVLERGNVVTEGGVVSARASKRALESVYGPTFKRGRLGNVAPETADFMAKSRALAELPSISNSGTMTRASLAALAGDVATTGGLGTVASAATAYGYYKAPMGVAQFLGGFSDAAPLGAATGGAISRLAYGQEDVGVEQLP